jgi:hypothetical protein
MVCSFEKYEKWHGKDCLLGTCQNCGVENLPICLVEDERSFNIFVNWKRYSTKTIFTKKGEEKKIFFFLHKSTSSIELIS